MMKVFDVARLTRELGGPYANDEVSGAAFGLLLPFWQLRKVSTSSVSAL